MQLAGSFLGMECILFEYVSEILKPSFNEDFSQHSTLFFKRWNFHFVDWCTDICNNFQKALWVEDSD